MNTAFVAVTAAAPRAPGLGLLSFGRLFEGLIRFCMASRDNQKAKLVMNLSNLLALVVHRRPPVSSSSAASREFPAPPPFLKHGPTTCALDPRAGQHS